MTNLAIAASTRLLVQLADPAVRTLLLASCAAIALVALKVRSTSLRLITWTAVLYAALSMPLLGWMLPAVEVPLPGFLHHAVVRRQASKVQMSGAPTPAVNASRTDRSMESSLRPNSKQIHPVAADSTAAPAVGALRSSIPWSTLAIALYGAVTSFLLLRLVLGVVFSRRLLRAAHLIHDDRVTRRLRSHVYRCRIKSAPHVVESDLISVPVSMGVLRSTILLPANWREWDDAKLNAVLAHELSHVARRDALTQRLSLLHRAIFWFSPLAWWLHRQLAAIAEQASDEAALSCGADRNDYARTLLGFFEALHASPGRVWWQGVSMAKAGQAEQRLERILLWKGVVTMGLKRSALFTIIAVALPVVYLAASVRPGNAILQDSGRTSSLTPPAPASSDRLEPALAPSAPESALAPPAPETLSRMVSNAGRLRIAVDAPPGPVAAAAPVAPPAPGPYQSAARPYSNHSYSDDNEPRFVIVTGKSDAMTLSGSREDARHAEKLKKQIPGDFIWFERDEQSYIIRDQATIDRARKLWSPQEELGKKQEELGRQQEALGKQQEELGMKMQQVQVKVPDLTAELDRLKAKLEKLGPSATTEQLGDLQSEIGDVQGKIGDIQSQAGEQQAKLGEQMGALGEQQAKLGEQQEKLGEQQSELAEQASRQMGELLDEAIKNGKAQPEPHNLGTGML
jgi:beta-lactamase regulating signal transducer with metallopeptidase domain